MNGRRRLRAGSGLWKYAGAVGKRISYGCSELPEDLSEGFFELVIDDHMLIVTKGRGRKL